MNRRKVKKKLELVLLNVVFIILCLAGLVPILYAASLSLSEQATALSSNFSLMQREITLENYRRILVEEPFLRWLWNSVVLAVGTVVVAMMCSVSCAYVFSRYRFKGRIQAIRGLLILNAFPQILTMFAIFRLFKMLHLLNNRLGLIIIYAGTMCIFSIQNLKGYFDTIPIEIEEASKIDGASEWQLLWKVILPLAKPAIIVTSVMVLIFTWNEYLFATTFMLNEETYTLAGGLYQLQANDYSRSWSLFTAAAILVSIPILIVFFVIQKHMVSGLTAGGVKG